MHFTRSVRTYYCGNHRRSLNASLMYDRVSMYVCMYVLWQETLCSLYCPLQSRSKATSFLEKKKFFFFGRRYRMKQEPQRCPAARDLG